MIRHAAALALLLGSAVLADSSPFTQNLKTDTERFSRSRSRLTGSSGIEQTRQVLLTRLRALPGVRTWTQEFTVTVPVSDSASLTIADGILQGVHAVYPLWPSGPRLNTTPAAGLTGNLVYVKKGAMQDIPATSIRGQIAVMEFDCESNWKNASSMGAAGILFLGNPDVTFSKVNSNLTFMPLNIPRFYIPEGPLADGLRAGRAGHGTLFAKGSWQTRTAVNIYSLIKPRQADAGQKALAFCAPYDASGVVPAFAAGADVAVDAAFLLNMAETWAGGGIVRPVMVCFADAYAVNQVGIRKIFETLAATDAQRKVYLRKDYKTFEEYAEHLELSRGISPDRDGIARITKDKFKALHPYIKDEVARDVVQVENVLQPLRLSLFRKKGTPEEDVIRAEIEVLEKQRQKFARAQRLMLKKDPVGDKDLPLTLSLWKRAADRIEGQYASLQGYLDDIKAMNTLRRQAAQELGINDNDPVPVEFMVGIDLSDAGNAIGPLLYCQFNRVKEGANAQDFTRWLKNTTDAEASKLFPGQLSRAFNLHPLKGTDSQDSYIFGPLPSLTSAAPSFGLGAVTLSTLEGYRHKVDTPQDRAGLLDWDRLTPQAIALRSLFIRLTGSDDFKCTYSSTPGWQRIEGIIVDQAPGDPVPRLPMPGYLTTVIWAEFQGTKEAKITGRVETQGVRMQEFVFTSLDGTFRMSPLPDRGFETWTKHRMVLSYDFAPDGSIVRAVDFNKSGKGVRLHQVQTAFKHYPLRAVMFNCQEMSVVGLHDPRLLFNFPSAQIIDLRRGNKPQRRNMLIYQDMVSFFLEPDITWQMVLRAGATRNRMLLLNMLPSDQTQNLPVAESMKGFKIGEPLPAHHTLQAAHDIYRLNHRRLTEYRKAGITSEAIDQLRERTGTLLTKADGALAADKGGAMYAAASGALANEVRAYQSIRDMANDVIRAAIFLLLMLIPFAFVMERLLIATPFIYKQLGGIFGIFAGMTAILWSFHPAFRISNQPLMIIMAFGIIFLSLMVISVVYGKFESGVEEMRSGRAESTAARTSRTGVLTSAFKLGVANMRKRKIRTALTGLTIVLITFALLCFTSASQYVSKREYKLLDKAAFNGILLKQPSGWNLPEAAIGYLDDVSVAGAVRSLRFWTVNPHNPQGMAHVINPKTGETASLPGILSISADEGRLTGLDRLLPDFDEFDKNGCYLATETAENMGVKAGDAIYLEGQKLRIIGLFDTKTVSHEALDLDGRSILPMDYSAMDENERQLIVKNDLANMLSQAESGAAGGKEYPHLRGAAVLINHADTRTDYGSIRSIAVGTKDGATAKKLANELAKRLAFPIYYGTEDGVFVLSATPLLPKAPKSLFIPLLIACLIIFNTMLSSVSERKREIHIYTSLGLAPMHIGVLFLAEAITYGLMGSIFGYIVGQGVATIFAKIGFMGGITLNYSGTQAIATMLMVLGVVILSSLVPAYMAGKMAVPSADRTWQVPQPVDDVITDTLPFTFTGQTAGGLMVFLNEYVDAHRDGSIGHYSSADIAYSLNRLDDLSFLNLHAVVWLAPYDLGVRQNISLSIRKTDEDDVFELDITVTREAGQVKTWWKLNKTFISDLRKQLLGWRKLKSWRIMEYVEQADRIIKDPDLKERG